MRNDSSGAHFLLHDGRVVDVSAVVLGPYASQNLSAGIGSQRVCEGDGVGDNGVQRTSHNVSVR